MLFVLTVQVSDCVMGVPGVIVPNSMVLSLVCPVWVQSREMFDATVVVRVVPSDGMLVRRMRVR